MFYFYLKSEMQCIEQFVKERQEIKPLRMCVSNILTLQKKIRCLSYIICSYMICLAKNSPCRYKVFHGRMIDCHVAVVG